MKKIDIFVCSDAEMRGCASWEEAFDMFPVTGITLPGELDFASLGQLLTQSAAPVFRTPRTPGCELYMFTEDMAQAIERIAADDLAGFLMELKANWHRSATPGKALLAWVDA
jgi:hypothetical protein